MRVTGGYFFAMNITTKNIDNYECELTVEFEWAEVEKAKKKAAKSLANRANIPGFRKGKAPLHILEQTYGKEDILDDAADILVQKAADEYIKTSKIYPVTQMIPKIITREEGKDFVFTLTFTPYPEVKVGEYKGLEVEKVVEPVKDEDIEKRLNDMRNHHANMVDAAEGSEVADGDFVTLDFVGTVDGEKFEGGEAEDYPLTIGSHSFIDNFEDQLIGAKVGEERDVKVTFPENYHVKKLAEKPAVFHCKINSIKHKELPNLDDEFAKKVSKFQTLDELKADVRKNLESAAERNALYNQQDKVIEKAVESITVDIPPVMIEESITNLIKEFEGQLQLQGMTLEQYMSMSGIDMDKMREDYRKTAEETLKAEMLFDEVARLENLKVENEDFNQEIAYMSMLYRANPKQIVKVLRENKQLSTVYANVLRRKARTFIIQNSNAAEKVEEKNSDSATEKTEPAEGVEQNLFEENKSE